MAYKYSKGKTYQGDIYNEDDTQRNTYLDWSEDAIGLVAGGELCLVVSGSSAVSSSLNLSASAFYGDGSGLSNISAAGSNAQIQFNDNGSTGATAQLYWSEANNRLGIGTNNPSKALDIEDADSAGIQLNATNHRAYTVASDGYGFIVHDNTTGGVAGYRFVISDQAAALGYVGIGAGASIAGSNHPDALLHLSSSDDGQIFRADTTDGTTVLFATGSGRVGIGTSTPAYTLDVQGYISIGSNGTAYIINNSDINTHIKLGGSGTPGLDGMTFTCGNKAMLTLDENGLDTVSIGTSGDATDFKVMTANTDYALYVSGGVDRVGIGTSTPASTLDISGSVGTNIVKLVGNVTVDTTHHTVLMGNSNTTTTCTLPAAASCAGRIYIFKRISSSATCKLNAASGEDIDDDQDAELTFDTQYDVKTVQSDGTAWWIINEVHMGAG